MSIINFLLTGDDLNSIIPEISAKEKEVRKVKREAVIEHIYNKKDYLKKQKESLEASLNQEDEENLDARIEDTVFQIASIEQKIRKLTDRSSKLVSEIYTISLKLEEASFLQERYKTLRSQYNADLKRLRFFIEGDKSSKKKIRMIECPFCGSEMKRDDSNTQSYVEASETELAIITEQLEDLKLVEKDVQAKITDLEGKI